MFNSTSLRHIGMYCVSFGMLGTAAFLVAWSGCVPQATDNTRIARSGRQPMHAIHSEQLTRMMRDLSRQASSPEEVRFQSMAGTTSPDMSSITSTAMSMKRSARKLPDLAGSISMSDEERQNFNKMAVNLEDAANDLKLQAQRNNLVGAKAAMKRLDGTCVACHCTFRLSQLETQ